MLESAQSYFPTIQIIHFVPDCGRYFFTIDLNGNETRDKNILKQTNKQTHIHLICSRREGQYNKEINRIHRRTEKNGKEKTNGARTEQNRKKRI